MQLTLVSHCGSKPAVFARTIREIQDLLGRALGGDFLPYAVEQVHGTIVGLEGTRTGNGVRNENFARGRGEEQIIQFDALLQFLRERFSPIDVRISGFAENAGHGFASQGQHPFARSFSIQNGIAVAIGWPWREGACVAQLDQLRRIFQEFGVLHKWHRRPGDVDNDFFFVLGRVNPRTPPESQRRAERQVREWLAAIPPQFIRIDGDSLSFVAYHDSQLPLQGSRALRLHDSSVTAEVLTRVYG